MTATGACDLLPKGSFPAVIHYEGYIRQRRLSDKGFHKFESSAGFNRYRRDFLNLRVD